MQSCIFQAGAQSLGNLVPNPSFEIYDTCPYNYFGINNALGWFNICNAAGEYFNTCSVATEWSVPKNDWGLQYPYCGHSYAFVAGHITIITVRENIGCRLSRPLIQNTEYCIGFYVSLADYSSAAIDQVGLLLTDSAVICPPTSFPHYPPVLSTYHPQIVSPKGQILSDTNNWTLITGHYIAHGGEEFLTIGVFAVNDSINWTYRHPYWSMWFGYYVDNVFVYECSKAPKPANAGNDTIVCLGDSVQLGTTNFLDYKYLWTSKGNIPDTTAKPWVSPLKNKKYYLWQTDFNCITTNDSVTVRVKDCEPKARAGSDAEICQGDSIQLSPAINPHCKYFWISHKTDTIKTAQPWVMPLESTYYCLFQIDKYDTISFDSLLISVKECLRPLEPPNVFTPNADGRNDLFEIRNPGNYPFTILIFNRWGSQVFKGDESHPWDGRQNNQDLPEGVYYYLITALAPKGQELHYQGAVHLLR